MTNQSHNPAGGASQDFTGFVCRGLLHFTDTLSRIDLDEAELRGALDLLTATALPVICSGVGKSAFIAAKLVATLNSLGVRSIYLNPTYALHGDLWLGLRRIGGDPHFQ